MSLLHVFTRNWWRKSPRSRSTVLALRAMAAPILVPPPLSPLPFSIHAWRISMRIKERDREGERDGGREGGGGGGGEDLSRAAVCLRERDYFGFRV
jgi:hypothetical protein